MKSYKSLFVVVLAALFLTGCSGEKKESAKVDSNKNMSKKERIAKRVTGPAQRDVIERIFPEYIMNMILNPEHI